MCLFALFLKEQTTPRDQYEQSFVLVQLKAPRAIRTCSSGPGMD